MVPRYIHVAAFFVIVNDLAASFSLRQITGRAFYYSSRRGRTANGNPTDEPHHAPIHHQHHRIIIGTTMLRSMSTPFEADLYDNPFEKTDEDSSMAVSPDTKLIMGVNKYSHDTTICAANAATGQVLFALSRERLSRRKHDGGTITSLVEECLASLDLELSNIERVVVNNHHHRVIPMEANLRHMEWENGLRINGGADDDGYTEPENRLPIYQELSHHLAHAYSTAAQAPFDSGLCVVMDGMGETYRIMQRSIDDPQYVSDFTLTNVDDDGTTTSTMQIVPSDIDRQAAHHSVYDFREAESVYEFHKSATGLHLRPLFKRFTPERTPPALHNHGFENMESLGALYSRASSHIFGDWNACGKVMGLAPWAHSSWTGPDGSKLAPKLLDAPIMWGTLYDEENSLRFNTSILEGEPTISRADPDLFDLNGVQRKRYDFDHDDDEAVEDKQLPTKAALEAIAVAHRIQTDLETVAMDFVRHWKAKTGQTNLCLTGGVCLNSVLNGRLSRELGFEQTFVSPYPGDEGIAIGCCAYGLFDNKFLDPKKHTPLASVPIWKQPLSVYQGPEYSDVVIQAAIDDAEVWIDVEIVSNVNEKIDLIAKELETGLVVAWYQSRSEMGPRALGHRSILADPRKIELVRFINKDVKSRETFRPFAPSVLAEEADAWFDMKGEKSTVTNTSPFMSITAFVKDDKRAQIPAVTHVDGTSRLQTVDKDAEPLYHGLISKFKELTGVPMVLNTSFNTIPGEPIVETPKDAIRSFLCSMGGIQTLVIGDYVIRRKGADLKRLLGEASKSGIVSAEQAIPKRTGPAAFESTSEVEVIGEAADAAQTRIKMPSRPMHGHGTEWFVLMDELEGEVLLACDGKSTLNDIMAQFEGVFAEDAKDEAEEAEILAQNVLHRMVRLYENTLIGW
jgi:predicted NodU family carbamoyl transferase